MSVRKCTKAVAAARGGPLALEPIVYAPAIAVERYGAGEQAEHVLPGDFILTHRRRRLMPMLIGLAQRRRFRGARRAFAHWSHAALVVGADGSIVEAEGTGVRRSPLARYRPEEYHLVRMDGFLDATRRDAAASAAERHVGDGFGYLTMLSVAVWLLTGLPARWHRRGHETCSGLVAHALAGAGQRFARDPAFVLPADLAETYGARHRAPPGGA
jgi:hypothetical protein